MAFPLQKRSVCAGFTLVELSIVLIIISLLVGGVMAGQNLIHSTRLRNSAAQVEMFQKAIANFRDQYGELPGDFSRAADVWGAAHAGGGNSSSCQTVVSIDKRTCNGDGDGRIESDVLGPNHSYEKLRAWQHLSNAGFIEGSYTGAYDGGSLKRDVNSPASDIKQGVYEMHHYTYSGVYGRHGHFIKLAAIDTTAANHALLTPPDAQSMDDKFDDGKPDRGSMVALSGTDASDCLVGSPPEYNLQNKEVQCRLYFWID